MGRKRYTEEQIALAISQHESGTAIAEMIRKMGISEQTIYRGGRRSMPAWALPNCDG
jgi:putative transposase